MAERRKTIPALDGVPQLVGADRVREVLDVTGGTIKALVRSGALRATKLPSGGYRYNVADLVKIAEGSLRVESPTDCQP